VDAVKRALRNAEIADRLASLAQLLSSRKENPYKIKAYRRAAPTASMNLSKAMRAALRLPLSSCRKDGFGRSRFKISSFA
jgi:DNA polymerase/3'-5' exonuclease PolX